MSTPKKGQPPGTRDQGRSRKALVLDLDNTMWGGVVGDDGLDGIVIGQGSALGEAHLDLQQYALDLGKRGIILAVCSKNDDAVARRAFREHPGMVLREDDIAAFVANWEDKATNIRRIREKIETDPENPRYLKTVRGAGYRFEMPRLA